MRERSLSWKLMATVNAAAAPDVVRAGSPARLGSHVLIAMGVAILCTVLLTRPHDGAAALDVAG